MTYELFYLIGASREAEVPQIKEKVKKIVTDDGGVFEEKETLEKRRLSYNIKKDTHGVYIAQRFELEDLEKLSDIRKKLNLEDAILRFILSRAEDLPPLKSKEERIAEATQKEAAAKMVRKEDKKPERQKPAEIEKDKVKKEISEKIEKEDIDKKLEEILNI